MKPFLLATACDGHQAQFAIQHWLPSVLDHLDQSEVDLVMFDCGLAEEHRHVLEAAGVECLAVSTEGIPSNIRFVELGRLLESRPYRRATLIDCGDLILQADISGLFRVPNPGFRAVCEDVNADFLHFMAIGDDLEPGYLADLQQRLREQPMINASGLVASRESWLGFCREFRQAARSLSCFGTDQFVVNGHLYRVGFERLPATYNLSLKTTRQPFTIRESRFYDQEGGLIVVAHNTGGRDPSRAIRAFGYGPGCNRGVRRIRKLATRWHYQLWRLFRR